MFFSHYSTIKYVDFESIHYIINMDDVSSFMVFSEFDHIFLSNVLLV